MEEPNPYESPNVDPATLHAGTQLSQSVRWLALAARGSLFVAAILIVFDVILSGSFLISYLVCPVWFLVSVVKGAIRLPGWRIALFRIAAPVMTLGIVLTLNEVQWKIAEIQAERIINACEEFHDANGRYPQSLNELVPRHLRSIPRAKYCLMFGDFWYFGSNEAPSLMWVKIPPFGRAIYNFEDRRWGYVD